MHQQSKKKHRKYYLYIPAGDLGQRMHSGCEETGITQLRCHGHQVLITQRKLLELLIIKMVMIYKLFSPSKKIFGLKFTVLPKLIEKGKATQN